MSHAQEDRRTGQLTSKTEWASIETSEI
jgi:hypothetical protein